MTEKTKDLAKTEEQEVDTALVAEACETIVTIFSEHANTAFIEVGKYLIEKFFDDNLESSRGYNDKEFKESSKGKTLKQVIDNFKNRGENDQNNPKGLSQSWLYQAINLVLQEEDLKSFQTYGKLLFSHKVVLLSVKDIVKKKKLIEETYKKNLTVRELKEKVAQTKEPWERGLLSIINNPDNFSIEKCKKRFTLDELKTLQHSKLLDLSSKIDKKKEKVEEELETLRNTISNYEDYLEEYDRVKSTVEEAIPIAAKNKRERKPKK